MSAVLHLLKGESALALATIERALADGDDVTVALLQGTPPPRLPAAVPVHRVPEELSWEALLDRIFAADQVISW